MYGRAGGGEYKRYKGHPALRIFGNEIHSSGTPIEAEIYFPSFDGVHLRLSLLRLPSPLDPLSTTHLCPSVCVCVFGLRAALAHAENPGLTCAGRATERTPENDRPLPSFAREVFKVGRLQRAKTPLERPSWESIRHCMPCSLNFPEWNLAHDEGAAALFSLEVTAKILSREIARGDCSSLELGAGVEFRFKRQENSATITPSDGDDSVAPSRKGERFSLELRINVPISIKE